MGDEVRSLLSRIHSLEEKLMQSRLVAEDVAHDMKKLQDQVRDAEQQADAAIKAQNNLQAVEKKAQSTGEMYRKLKEKHLLLVDQFADLLRKNADTKRQAESLQQNAGEFSNERTKYLEEIDRFNDQVASLRVSAEDAEKRRLLAQREMLDESIKQAISIVESSVASLDDDTNSRTCNATTLINITEKAMDASQRLHHSYNTYRETKDASNLLSQLASFGHWIGTCIENGGATCNMAPDQNQSSALEISCRECGSETIKLLEEIQSEPDQSNDQGVTERLEKILQCAKDLLPSMSDVGKGDLSDVVEQEMFATTKAVEQASERIEALLNEARLKDSGINLEVNERILDSCTDLMKFIRVLIDSSKELQREIVDRGRGASSTKEFYMKNSRWTEGLISAAKAVGWGATMLTDAADLVIQGEGKFEELMVCSHEISASTAQLVAASRVKAPDQSEKLKRLQAASRNVNGATARVVASTNTGRRQLDEASNSFADLSNAFTLTQIKRKEMDSQVRVLELEQALDQERLKLGAWRKKAL